MKFYKTIFFLFLFNISAFSQQKIIKFVNASFEIKPANPKEILGWQGCEMGTTPDLLPGQWNVWTPSSEGKKYIGLCTREEGTWESIGQKTTETLKADECYEFSLDLAHSKTYAGYNKPVKLRVWGGKSLCGKTQLLEETKFVDHGDWRTYKVDFYVEKDIDFIILEAFYTNGKFKHKGNILIDNISDIKTCIRA